MSSISNFSLSCFTPDTLKSPVIYCCSYLLSDLLFRMVTYVNQRALQVIFISMHLLHFREKKRVSTECLHLELVYKIIYLYYFDGHRVRLRVKLLLQTGPNLMHHFLHTIQQHTTDVSIDHKSAFCFKNGDRHLELQKEI